MNVLRPYFWGLCLVGLLLVACDGDALTPTSPAPATPTTQPELPGVTQARQELAGRLGVTPDEVTLTALEYLGFPDLCLGAFAADEACYRFQLTAGTTTALYHTNASGSGLVEVVESPRPGVGGLVLTYGADTCRVIGLQREAPAVAAGLCRTEFTAYDWSITPAAEAELDAFLDAYAPFSEATPAGFLDFNGRGQQPANPAEQLLIAQWVQWVGESASAGRDDLDDRLVFTWTRQGGIAGFCDELAIYLTGLARAGRCGDADAARPVRYLTGAEATRLYDWLAVYTTERLERSDGAVADSLTEQLEIRGQGEQAVDETGRDALLAFAADLFNQLMPPDSSAPTPTPEVVENPSTKPAAAFCPTVARPALVVHDGNGFNLTNPITGATCPLTFPSPLSGWLQVTQNNLYYTTLDEAGAMSLVRLDAAGNQTSIISLAAGPHTALQKAVVRPDEGLLAWSLVTNPAPQDPDRPATDVYIAALPDSQSPTLTIPTLTALVDPEGRILEPLRFSADGQTLYLAYLPYGVGGIWNNFSGRYDALAALDVTAGSLTPLFDCAELGLFLCLGDFTENVLAYVDAHAQVQVISYDGAPLATVAPDLTDYVGYPTFSPTGDLLVYAAAVATETFPLPRPGALYLLPAPYTGDVELIQRADGILPPAWWLDATHLIGSYTDVQDNWGMAIYSLDGALERLQPWPTAQVVGIAAGE